MRREVIKLTKRGLKVLVQAGQLCEGAMAEIALVGARVGVPGPGGCLKRVRARPADQVLGDEARGILLPDEAVDGIAVDALGVGARAALDVVHEARGGGEAALAEGAGDGGTDVHRRPEVLLDVVEAPERAVAVGAVVVVFDLVLLAHRLRVVRLVAAVTLPIEMVLVIFVLPLGA